MQMPDGICNPILSVTYFAGCRLPCTKRKQKVDGICLDWQIPPVATIGKFRPWFPFGGTRPWFRLTALAYCQ